MKPDYGLKNLLPIWQTVLFATVLPFVLVITLVDMWINTLWIRLRLGKEAK